MKTVRPNVGFLNRLPTHGRIWYLCITELHDGNIVKESPIFDGNNHGFRLRFSQENHFIDLLKFIKTQ